MKTQDLTTANFLYQACNIVIINWNSLNYSRVHGCSVAAFKRSLTCVEMNLVLIEVFSAINVLLVYVANCYILTLTMCIS